MVISDELIIKGVFLHADEGVDAFEDGLAEAVEVSDVGELLVVQLCHQLARFSRVVGL